MSSLSQEDLGVGRVGSDVALATARPDVPTDTKSLPPDSMTLETAAIPIESMVVPSATQVPLVTNRAESAPFDFESPEAARDEASPLRELLPSPAAPAAAGQVVGGSGVCYVPLMQSRPLRQSPSEAVQAIQPERVPASESHPLDAARQPEAPDEEQIAEVARRMRQLAEVAPLESYAVPIEVRSPIEVLVAGENSDDPHKEQNLLGHAHVRTLRMMVWSAAALVGLVISYWALHGGNGPRPNPPMSTSRAASLSPDGSSKSQTDAVIVSAAVRPVRPVDAPRVNKTGVEPVSAVQSESFADAFLKHAASANSSWAEVKKRTKAADSQFANRSNQPAASAASDNPLGVLDQLEIARKAKKQTSGQP
jgi:hypothetical protein